MCDFGNIIFATGDENLSIVASKPWNGANQCRLRLPLLNDGSRDSLVVQKCGKSMGRQYLVSHLPSGFRLVQAAQLFLLLLTVRLLRRWNAAGRT